MSDPIENYSQLLSQREGVIARIEEMQLRISHAASALRDYSNVMVTNYAPGVSGGTGLSSKAQRINAKKWPTGDDIGEALAEYHKLRTDLRNAWSAVPEGQRGALRPPPMD